MSVLYHLTVPPSPLAACDAVAQEVETLLAHFGGELASSSLDQALLVLLLLGGITLLPIIIKWLLKLYEHRVARQKQCPAKSVQ